ncbi:MAG: branched-chain amino acid ABC transporter ATP-binding protein/permease [Armatimonadota bacterium]|nr:branched-chain amino acid ABC transporter ATP-binding protein/permease [Armatimonadota bacterium]MDR7450900.1 branched-chain amino acid ABC transporter ATP-binding protein/permease [Armatimonadota bacterium]MDR7465822.1 branched-chain amino acid ABC transporter ATP-binding protein/permease [Armatimonadota bacterium]MDR7493730.1 branched-chain amino acid ABC transporter ATP-binding protein/permease [Armatimonadota bacterium]MDR7498336.1 branched-chain amino acid ABC transporter ATP-binding pr
MGTDGRSTRPPRRLAGAAVLAGFLAIAPLLPQYYLHILILAVIAALFALSLDVLMGYVGLPSLGHAAYFGAAAYTLAILVVRYGIAWGIAVPLALLAGTVLAGLFGVIAIRTVDVFFMMVTLALSQILWGIVNRWGSFTGGYNGIPGIPRPLPILESGVAFFYLTTLVLAATYILVRRLIASPFGLTLQGIRDREIRMSVLGYRTWLHKYAAFVLCGGIAGVAGILSALYTGFVSPADLSIRTSAEVVLMVVMGGTGTLIGPLLGAGVLVGLRNLLSVYLERWPLVLGLIFMVTVMYAPNGIVGWIIEKRTRRRDQLLLPAPSHPLPPGHRASPSPSYPPERPALGANKPTAALRLEGVSKMFGGLRAVDDVTFSIDAGERVALVGPNGAGKTTLFNLISGTIPASQGRILLFGTEITRLPPYRRAALGLARTFQISTLFPSLTAQDNVRLALMALQRTKYVVARPVDDLDAVNAHVRFLLEQFDLWAQRLRPVGLLSHGEQRLLEILLAVASRPKVLLLDEPTSGVAAAEVVRIVEMVKHLDASIAILIIEHDMDVAFALAHRIMVLHYGKLLTVGAPEEVARNPLVQKIYLGTE